MHYRLFLIAIYLSLIASPSMAFGTSSGDYGEGCCGDSSSRVYYESIVQNLAVSYGADPIKATEVYNDLVRRPQDELLMIKEAPEPCDVYGQCLGLPGQLLKAMGDAAVKQQDYQTRYDSDWWRNIAAIGSAVTAAFALALSVLNYLEARARKSSGI